MESPTYNKSDSMRINKFITSILRMRKRWRNLTIFTNNRYKSDNIDYIDNKPECTNIRTKKGSKFSFDNIVY